MGMPPRNERLNSQKIFGEKQRTLLVEEGTEKKSHQKIIAIERQTGQLRPHPSQHEPSYGSVVIFR